MKTKKHVLTLVLALTFSAVFALMMGGTAIALPTTTSGVCSNCHAAGGGVTITVSKASETATTETWNVSGSTTQTGNEGRGLFANPAGTTALQAGAGSGSFIVNKGAGGVVYNVYWVDDSSVGFGNSATTTITTTMAGGGGDTTVPTNPSNLTATAVSSSQINLTWTASTDNVGVTGYTIYRAAASGGPYTLVGTDPTPIDSATGLTASTAYWFRVRAYDAAGNSSGDSNTATATTPAVGVTPPPPPPTTGAYSQVTGTVHNMATAGTGVCASCHVAHNAFGDNLWARPIGTTFTGTKALCYSCHDGTIANEQYAFSATYAQHAGECNMCHDPHNNTYGNFLKFATGANLCNDCHGSDIGAMSHPVNVAASMVPTDATFAPTSDMSGTRLYNTGGTATGTYIKCLTCHTAHGGVAGTKLLTMQYSATSAALCTNCHP